jgi:hypothetical protein
MDLTKLDPIFQEALNDARLAVVGRVRTALTKPEMETLPASCTTYMPRFRNDDDILSLIRFVSKALRTGAGVNIHLDNFEVDTRPTNPAYFNNEITFETDPPLARRGYSYKVSDSMERDSRMWVAEQGHTVEADGRYWPSIEVAIFNAYFKGAYGYSVNFDLSNLRPAGVQNRQGMVSSGPESFANIFRAAFEFGKNSTLANFMAFLSSFNQELRRGGTYKNGALTTSMPCWSNQAEAYLMLNKAVHPWVKKGFVVTQDFLENTSQFGHLYAPTIRGINNGTLWLEKAVCQDLDGDLLPIFSNQSMLLKNRLLSNVCREVFLQTNETCDLLHVNAGQCLTFDNLMEAFAKGMKFLCELKNLGLTRSAGIYKDPTEDRQVGLGVLGLANQLAILGITYQDFNEALDKLLAMGFPNGIPENFNISARIQNAEQLAFSYFMAYREARQIALNYNMRRAFVIAPTANSSFRHRDILGYTTAPEISPPIDIQTERVSETVSDPEIFYYNPDSEVANKVGWSAFKHFMENWQRLMQSTGLAHSISFNVWEDFDIEEFEWFMGSSLKTTYYRLNVNLDYFDKSNPTQQLTCECAG